MNEGQSSLAELRRQIDDIDAELLVLMNRRARVAQSVGSLKQTGQRSFYQPGREAQVLRRVAALNDGPLTSRQIGFVFREIMSACLALEAPLTVGYPRSDGFAGERAVRERFGRCVDPVPVEDIAALIRAVESCETDLGVVPVGGLTPTLLECLRGTGLMICAEGALELSPDRPERYWVIGTLAPPPSGKDRTTMLLHVGLDDEGIDEALGPFTERGVDLSRIETLAREPGVGDGIVCVDAEGHAGDEPLAGALEALRGLGRLMGVLGSYPCAEGEADS